MYFTPDFLAFFRELADNNNRPWFETQKPRYEASVKAPLEALCNSLLAGLSFDGRYWARTSDPQLVEWAQRFPLMLHSPDKPHNSGLCSIGTPG